MATVPSALFDSPSPSSRPCIFLPGSSSVAPRSSITLPKLGRAVAAFRADINALGLGIGVGDSISSSLINGLEFVVAFLATGTNRSIASPLNPSYSIDEVKFYLTDCRSKLLLVHKGSIPSKSASPPSPAVQAARELGVPVAQVWWDNHVGRLRLEIDPTGIPVAAGNKGEINTRAYDTAPWGEARPEDVALVLHTSGTTGRPKAVPLSHQNLITSMRNIADTYRLTKDDRSYLVMPLFHVHGLLAGLLSPLYAKSSVVIPPKFSAGVFWTEFKENACNWYTAVPTIHQILLQTPAPKPLPKLRFIRSCSSALSPATFEQLEQTFKAPVLEAYAMTEACHQMASNPLPPHPRKPGTVGIGHGVEVRVLTDAGTLLPPPPSHPGSGFRTFDVQGEVCVQGTNVTAGYINNDKANAESFVNDEGKEVGPAGLGERWFRTGDRGKFDSQGYLVLTGRIKELINRGGEKISPLEVDAVLLSLNGVAEAVSFGVEDAKYGEKVWAAIVPKEGTQLQQEEIRTAVAGKLSKFKIPERIFIVSSIPKTATGKIQRRNVAAKFAEEAKNEPKAKL